MQVARCRFVARALLGTALVVVLGALTLAGPAGAATYETSVSPDPFSYPETERLVYRLHITTGSQPERLRVSARGPSFPGGGEFMALAEMALEGPGTVIGRGGFIGHGDRFCTPVLPDFHGSMHFSSPLIEVEIPANSTSAVALPARPYTGTGSAPWLGMDLAVEFAVGQDQQAARTVRSPTPANSGRHGVRIGLNSDPAGVPGGCPASFTPVAFGNGALVTGEVDTALAGQLMTLRAVRSEPAGGGFGNRTPVGGAVELARVRIGEDGSFAYRWQPTQPGDYTLGALYQSQSSQFADDFSMPLNLRVGQPQSYPPMIVCGSIRARRACSVRSNLLRPSARGRRRGGVIVSRARGVLLGTGGSPCSGQLTLGIRSGSKRVGVRYLRLDGNCRWSKRYAIPIRRLPPRQRRRLANRKPVTLTVTARFQGSADLSPDRSPTRAYRIKP